MQANGDTSLSCGPFRIDPSTHQFFRDNNEVKLKPYAFECLFLLLKARGRIVTYGELLSSIWHEPEGNAGERSIRSKIREIIRPLGNILGSRSNGRPWLQNIRNRGYRLEIGPDEKFRDLNRRPAHSGNQSEAERMRATPNADAASRNLPDSLLSRIDELSLSQPMAEAVRTVLTAKNYPMLMMLSNEPVKHPIWEDFISAKDRRRLAKDFSPFGPMPPKMMHLDIFLLKAKDESGRPLLLNHFSGKPITGWQAFILLFRDRAPGENERLRQRLNAEDIAGFLTIPAGDITVKSLGNRFVVSVKPDPGYKELVLYIFEFCAVTFRTAPAWLCNSAPEMKLETSTRRFRWTHPEESESLGRTMLVDGDVLKGVHRFFATTLPAVPVGFPAVIQMPSKL